MAALLLLPERLFDWSRAPWYLQAASGGHEGSWRACQGFWCPSSPPGQSCPIPHYCGPIPGTPSLISASPASPPPLKPPPHRPLPASAHPSQPSSDRTHGARMRQGKGTAARPRRRRRRRSGSRAPRQHGRPAAVALLCAGHPHRRPGSGRGSAYRLQRRGCPGRISQPADQRRPGGAARGRAGSGCSSACCTCSSQRWPGQRRQRTQRRRHARPGCGSHRPHSCAGSAGGSGGRAAGSAGQATPPDQRPWRRRPAGRRRHRRALPALHAQGAAPHAARLQARHALTTPYCPTCAGPFVSLLPEVGSGVARGRAAAAVAASRPNIRSKLVASGGCSGLAWVVGTRQGRARVAPLAHVGCWPCQVSNPLSPPSCCSCSRLPHNARVLARGGQSRPPAHAAAPAAGGAARAAAGGEPAALAGLRPAAAPGAPPARERA